MIHFWWLIHFSTLIAERKNFMYLIDNVAIVEKLQNFKRSDENEFIDLNCGIQVTKVGLSSDWWFKYKSNSNLNNHTCSLYLQTHFLHFERIWDTHGKPGQIWNRLIEMFLQTRDLRTVKLRSRNDLTDCPVQPGRTFREIFSPLLEALKIFGHCSN